MITARCVVILIPFLRLPEAVQNWVLKNDEICARELAQIVWVAAIRCMVVPAGGRAL
jgi:hypothetical protein